MCSEASSFNAHFIAIDPAWSPSWFVILNICIGIGECARWFSYFIYWIRKSLFVKHRSSRSSRRQRHVVHITEKNFPPCRKDWIISFSLQLGILKRGGGRQQRRQTCVMRLGRSRFPNNFDRLSTRRLKRKVTWPIDYISVKTKIETLENVIGLPIIRELSWPEIDEYPTLDKHFRSDLKLIYSWSLIFSHKFYWRMRMRK